LEEADEQEVTVEPEQQALLKALNVFRFGFTQQMASILWKTLGHESVQVRDVLNEFCDKGLLRYGIGEYHVPANIGAVPQISKDPVEHARAHYAAGIAMAPYLSLSNVPAIAFDRAFQPEMVHEAQFHLKESYKALEKNERDPFRQVVVTALQRLQRFAEYPGWHAVGNLHKTAPKDAYELAMDLIESREATGTPAHPVQLLTAIDAVEQRWNQLRTSSTFKDQNEVEELYRKIEEMFEQAFDACDRPEWRSERDYNRLFVITQKCLFLQKYQGILPLKTGELAALTKEAGELLSSGVDGTAIKGEWHEMAGDLIGDHASAERAYAFGVRWKPEWRQLWIKQVGCLKLTGKQDAAAKVTDLADELAENIVKSSIVGLRRDRKKPKRPWVKLRWESGIEEFTSRLGSDPAFSELFAQYARELAQWR
jgi:hypothetical protein